MRNLFKLFLVILIINIFIMRPASSYADWNGQDDGHKHNNGNNNNNSSGNNGHSNSGGGSNNDGDRDGKYHRHSYVGIDLNVVPDNYYYGASYYPPEDDVLVSQPIYQPVVINGTTYYLNNGTYYVYNGYSYQEAVPPVTYVQQPVEVVQPPVVIDNQVNSAPIVGSDSFTINIPNTRGGYTAVIIKKSGTGYLGPQGEFYPDFPKVSQLELMYGK